MAIVREFYGTRFDGVDLYKTYSDEDYMIQKVGTNEIYQEAIDVSSAPYVYVETDEKVEDILNPTIVDGDEVVVEGGEEQQTNNNGDGSTSYSLKDIANKYMQN